MDDRRERGTARLVVDRGWSLHVGKVRLGRWNRVYIADWNASAQPQPMRAPPFVGRAALGGLAIGILTFTGTSMMIERVGAKPAYAITIPIPSAPASGADRAHKSASSQPVRPARASLTAAGRPTKTHSQRHAPELAPGEADATAVLASEAAQALAVKTALATGDVQEWVEDAAGIRGFVVAGPVRDEDGKQCRTLSVLIRSTVRGNQVEQRHDCLP